MPCHTVCEAPCNTGIFPIQPQPSHSFSAISGPERFYEVYMRRLYVCWEMLNLIQLPLLLGKSFLAGCPIFHNCYLAINLAALVPKQHNSYSITFYTQSAESSVGFVWVGTKLDLTLQQNARNTILDQWPNLYILLVQAKWYSLNAFHVTQD